MYKLLIYFIVFFYFFLNVDIFFNIKFYKIIFKIKQNKNKYFIVNYA